MLLTGETRVVHRPADGDARADVGGNRRFTRQDLFGAVNDLGCALPRDERDTASSPLPVSPWATVMPSSGRCARMLCWRRRPLMISVGCYQPISNQRDHGNMLNRIFGLETEYGLLIHQDRPDHSPTWFAHKLRDHIFHSQRRGVLDLHHRGHDEPPGNGGFLTNAGRMYLDMGHLEYASPECESLTDVVASDRAGDHILQQAIEELGWRENVSLIKNNIDHETDATFGSHENYLVTRRFPFTKRGLAPLVTFLVTRQILPAQDEWGLPVLRTPGSRWIV